MKTKYLQICILSVLLAWLFVAGFNNSWASQPPAQTQWDSFKLPDGYFPGYQGLLVFKIIPDQGIYTYSFDPGPAGYPTELNILGELGDRFQVYYPKGEVRPDPFDPTEMTSLYLGTAPIFIPVPDEVDKHGTIQARVSFLLCSDRNCWPVNKNVQYDLSQLDFSSAAKAIDQSWWPKWLDAVPGGSGDSEISPTIPEFTDDRLNMNEYEFDIRSFSPGLEVSNIAMASILAMLAGLVLNFMPCVLPVISLKLRGMIPDSSDGQSLAAKRRAFRMHNLCFAAGMLVFFVFLAVLISVTGMAWGQIFQNPMAIVVLGAIVFGLGLSLFGLYDLPIIDLKSGSKAGYKNPYIEAVSTGMLATLLATPCSGPFLGGVLAWALTQPPATIAFVLLCVGVGMASPYIIMSIFPFMVGYLPKPGNWTLYLEKGIGFLLMATCIYLITLLPETLIMEALILFWVIGLGAWMWGKWTSLSQTRIKRSSIRAAALALIILSSFLLFKPRTQYPVAWISFEEQKFHSLWGEEDFLMEFTADWCPNCKFLEKTVLTPAYMEEIQEHHDLLFLRVDLTYQNPAGEAMLRALDSMSIPLVAIFNKDNPESPLILRDLFTRKQLMKALNQELE
ncbi:MAG: cytochrome c biogenesis protein CcdA [Desulfonatronovibrio sp.]